MIGLRSRSISTFCYFLFLVLLTAPACRCILVLAIDTAPAPVIDTTSALSGTRTSIGGASSTINKNGPKKRARRAVAGEYISETGFYQSISLTDDVPILQRKSRYQDISILKSKHYGKILMLDGVIQLTEKDADSYNEMMAHPAMFSHPNPRRVLIIGGGDGYVLSEVLKHSEVEHVDHVDLDGDVIDVCRNHFEWGQAWEDPRVTLHVADGAAFVKNVTDGFYDVIIQDSSDPYTWEESTGEKIELPSNTLYALEHFENVYRVLRDDGVFSFQAESFNIESDLNGIVEWRLRALNVGFADARYGSISISSYPTGQIGFLLCRKDPISSPSMETINYRFGNIVRLGKSTSYYHPMLQDTVFSLPLWVERRIYQNDSSIQ